MNAYLQYQQESVATGSPLDLVCALYQRAVQSVDQARRCHESRDRLGRGRAVSTASDVIAELIVSLDHQRGGDLSQRLGELYGYMLVRLTEAHCKDVDGPLGEVRDLLATLWDGWRSVAAGGPDEPAVQGRASWGNDHSNEAMAYLPAGNSPLDNVASAYLGAA